MNSEGWSEKIGVCGQNDPGPAETIHN